MIAPVVASGGVSLAPRSTSDLSLVGRLVPQSSPNDLAEVSQIFNNFVAGKTSNVVVEGASAGPSSVGSGSMPCLPKNTHFLIRLPGLMKASSH